MENYLGEYYVFGEREELNKILSDLWSDEDGLNLSVKIEQSVDIYLNVLVFRHEFTTCLLIDEYLEQLKSYNVTVYSMITLEDGPEYIFNFTNKKLSFSVTFNSSGENLEKFKKLDLSVMGVIKSNKDFMFKKDVKYILETKENALSKQSKKESESLKGVFNVGLLKDGEDW